MSLFLGKIHYWLFDKIIWFEDLEKEIISLAKQEHMDVKELENQINSEYGRPLENKNLEEIIDKDNIHAWLQNKIHSAEGRMAAWTSKILKKDPNSLDKLREIYKCQAIKAAKNLKASKTLNSAVDIYNSINDFLLDGMPCDRVDEILKSGEDNVTWSKRICLHKDIWQKEDINVRVFYDLRDTWIKYFVDEINDDFEFAREENNYVIRKK